jgi:hypothetical protein
VGVGRRDVERGGIAVAAVVAVVVGGSGVLVGWGARRLGLRVRARAREQRDGCAGRESCSLGAGSTSPDPYQDGVKSEVAN